MNRRCLTPHTTEADRRAPVQGGVHQQKFMLVMYRLRAAFGIPHTSMRTVVAAATNEAPAMPTIGAFRIDPLPHIAHQIPDPERARIVGKGVDRRCARNPGWR